MTTTVSASAFMVVRIAATTASMALYVLSFDAHLRALDHIEYGSRVVAFVESPCGHSFANWRNSRLYHAPSMAIVRKDAFVNTEWQIEGLHLLRVKYSAAWFDSEPSQSVTLGCDVPGSRLYKDAVTAFPRAAFDYLWLFDIPAASWPNEPGLVPVWSSDDSALFRVVHAPGLPAH